MEKSNAPAPGSGVRYTINYFGFQPQGNAMEKLDHAAPGWARGNGILNTWLPASTLFQWRWTELRISCLAGRPAPTILLTIWLQAWAMGNGKVARGSPARFRAPGAWYRYIWV
jgi:hypothetical protein